MIRALWTGATGMIAQQLNMDNVAHNLANVNTTGFKRSRVDFQDLLYQTHRLAGTPVAVGPHVPTGIQIGVGSNPTATQKIFTPGSLKETNNRLDMAIFGDGFFQILLPDGTIGYTRDGSFKLSAEGQIVTSDGYLLEPEIVIPEDTTNIMISENGEVTVLLAGDEKSPVEVGRIQIVNFVNPAGLKAMGKNIFKETAASGEPIVGEPGMEGFGEIRQFFLEMSNVQIIDEMVDMIVAQRAYEINSRSIRTADMMLQQANQLKR
jgi:flagellar basal-body rod protein FlgG